MGGVNVYQGTFMQTGTVGNKPVQFWCMYLVVLVSLVVPSLLFSVSLAHLISYGSELEVGKRNEVTA